MLHVVGKNVEDEIKIPIIWASEKISQIFQVC
jgi:hypothetical protein